MSGSLIGGIVGATIGFIVGGPTGAMYGFSAGSMAGGLLFPQHVDGPRLTDLKPQASEYGRPIPIVYGTVALGGNVIWAPDYIVEKSDSGGKGGPTVTTEAYFGHFAIAFAEGECNIGRMWAGPEKRLIWDGVTLEGGGKVRFYSGSEDQLPDPLIESYLGVGNVPAYRGTCYVVLEHFPLVKDGNTLPFITAEIGAKAGAHGQAAVYLGATVPTPSSRAAIAAVDPSNGWIWNVIMDGADPADTYSVSVINDADKSVVASFPNRPLALLGGYVVNVVPMGGFVYIVTAQFGARQVADNDYRDTNLALVDVFSSGSANPDGSTNAVPAYLASSAFGSLRRVQDTLFVVDTGGGTTAIDEGTHPCDPYGGPGPDLGLLPYGTRIETTTTSETPIFARAASTDGARPWIAYASTNIAVSLIYAFTSATDFEGAEIGTIGTPIQVLGDGHYMAVAGSGGPVEDNFAILSSTGAPSLLHTLAVPHAESGKAFDYDPERQVFFSYEPNSMAWHAVDAPTGVITSRTLTVGPGDTSPAPTGFITAVSYSSRADKYLFGATSGLAGTGTTIYVVNPDSGEVEATYTFEDGGQMINPLLDPAATAAGAPYVLSFDQNNVKRLYIAGALEAAPIDLGGIVADLSIRAGLTLGQINVDALTDTVDGYTIARQTTVRNAIDALRPAYYFDAVESGGVVKYVKRGGAPVATIDADDLDARSDGESSGDPLLTTRQMEVELPRVVNVNYLLAATDYSPATKAAKRLVGASGNENTLELPLVLTDTKAQEIADVNLQVSWIQRLSYAFNLPRRYSDLEPTDHIVVKGNGMRLTKVTHTPQGIMKCEAVADGATFYTPNTTTTETLPNPTTIVYAAGTTALELM